jgi:pilus assembly protein Flp/PilA
MNAIQFSWRDMLRDESGVTAIEYALVASLIAAVIIGAVVEVGNTLQALWDKVAGCVVNPSSCA